MTFTASRNLCYYFLTDTKKFTIMNDYEKRIKQRQEDREERRIRNRKRTQTWLVIGVVVLVVLLFFWVDIADLLGWGDGAA